MSSQEQKESYLLTIPVNQLSQSEINGFDSRPLKQAAQVVEDENGEARGEIFALEGGDVIVALDDKLFLLKFEQLWNSLAERENRSELTTKNSDYES